MKANRYKFIEEQSQTTEQRVQTIENLITAEEANIAKYQESQENIQVEIRNMEEDITTLQEEMKAVKEDLEEKTKIVEQVKRTTSKSSKALDQALKEIATRVSVNHSALGVCSHPLRQNDEIEKLGLERSAIYRKCRLDEVWLPLVKGNLKNVPMEEVCACNQLSEVCLTRVPRTCARKSLWTSTRTKKEAST